MKRLVDLFIDPIRMIQDIRRELSRGMGIWGPALNFPQLLGGIYYFGTIEGRLIFFSWLLMIITAGYIHRHQPFSRLIGVSQVWWFPILPLLLGYAWQQTELSIFSVWLWYVCSTMGISLVLDVFDFHRYITTDDRRYARRNK
ncbi:MAG: hypothetical protein V7727_19550 [Sneathiella sp.]